MMEESVVALLFLSSVTFVGALNFDLSSYVEVYPDPSNASIVQGRRPLYFALIQSLGGSGSQFDGSGSVAGVKVALDRINSDPSLLPGYTLHYTFADSKCNRTESLNALFSQLQLEPTKIAIVGSGCSPATEPTAEISHFFNLTQISCVSSSTALRNRLRYPFYFQLLSTEETLAFAYYGAIKEYGWRKLALIVQNENLFTVMLDTLKKRLDADNINYTETTFETSNGIAQLGDRPFDTQQRIFLLAMYSVHARPLLCKAYEQGIRLPRYLLLTPGWYSRLWWREQDAQLTCTVEQRESVLQQSLAFLQFEFLNGSDPEDLNFTSSTGITGQQFLEEEQQFLGIPPLNITGLEYSQYCYDAIWTLAYALNDTINSLSDPAISANFSAAYNVTNFRLEDFSYSNDLAKRLLFQHLEQTNFTGITGSVQFGPQGIRSINELTIFQFRTASNETHSSLDWVRIGIVTPSGDSYDFSYVKGFDEQVVWEGMVPYDGVPEIVWVGIHPAVVTIFVILGVVGIALAIACLVFNIYFRKAKLVKLASTKLNSLVILGAIVLYVDIIFTVIPSTNGTVITVFCNFTPWLSAIGYSLCYGTILVKMARVYYIFNNPSPDKKAVYDWMLILAVLSLVAVDIVIIIIYTAVEGSMGALQAQSIVNRENPRQEQGVQGRVTEFYVWVCTSLPRDVFLAVLYGYKMALQILALVFAFSIRKVKVKGLDDSKYVAAAIYVTSLAQAVIIVATFTVTPYINGFAVLFSISFFIGTTAILLLVFVPLMVGLYKDPKGEDIFSRVTGSELTSMHQIGLRRAGNANDEALKKKISDLEAELRDAREEITTLGKKKTSKRRKDSVTSALENANMIESQDRSNAVRGRDNTGTIWDSPEEREAIAKGEMSNGTVSPDSTDGLCGSKKALVVNSTHL